MTKSSKGRGSSSRDGKRPNRPRCFLSEHPYWEPRLKREWNYEKNAELGLDPAKIPATRRVRAWWHCNTCGQDWLALIDSRTGRTQRGCPFCAGQRPIPGVTDLASTNPDLAQEWHPTENGSLTPQDVMRGSKKKVWWLGVCGHEWEATVAGRSSGHGCPYCAGRKLLAGFNDLESQRPDLAAEWHPNKNGQLTPRDVTVGTHRRVWGKDTHGHEWEATVVDRANGYGCPYCAGRKLYPDFNDLESQRPDLAKEWHPTKNGQLTPRDIIVGARRRVWWKDAFGHEWEASVVGRVRGRGCPYCSGLHPVIGINDLATTHPDLAREWHPTKNGTLMPQDVSAGSGRKVWWLGTCGHEWDAIVKNRTAIGSGCPICAGKSALPGFNDLNSTHPDLSAEWHPTKNGELTPMDVTAGSHARVFWLGTCGHEWAATVKSRALLGCGCPKCPRSRGEEAVVEWTVENNFEVECQWTDEKCRDIQPLRFDAMLYAKTGTALMEVALVEYDGEQHSNSDFYLNQKGAETGHGYGYVVRHDGIKNDFCKKSGRLLIRVPYTVTGTSDVGRYIEQHLCLNGFGWWFAT